jgi:hypothetical protein
MSFGFVLLPLFVQVILTFALYCWMAYHRVTSIRSGVVHPRDVALRQPNWPPRVLQIANAAHNQLELPLLFYVLTILSIMTRHADILFVVLSWIFVLSRLGHAYIHVTSNRVPRRGAIFGIGLLVLMIMWLIFIVRILAGLP